MSELLRHLNSNIDISRPLDSTIGPILWRHFSDTIIIIEEWSYFSIIDTYGMLSNFKYRTQLNLITWRLPPGTFSYF